MRRDKWQPTSSSYICGEHFHDSDYLYPSSLPHSNTLLKRYLKKEAVPSKFNFPPHLVKKAVKERNPKQRITDRQQYSPVIGPPTKVKREDHTYACSVSPRKLKKQWKEKLRKKNKVIENLRRKVITKEKTIKGLVEKLKQAKLLSAESCSSFVNNFGHMTTEIFKNETKNNGRTFGSTYSEEIKQFAISLKFYSPRAYNFVRKYLSLPHPATLRSWSTNIDCEPGFLKAPQKYISDLVNDNQGDCVIIIDEMSIKKQTCWDPKNDKFVGNVDYGSFQGEDVDNIATNALVVMVAGLKKPWSVPLAYFLTDKLNANVLCQLITESIEILTEVGANVHAIVFDGAPKNISMAEKLGCNVKKLEYFFPHPSELGTKIYIIFDICHMVKLARNAFSDMKIFCTPSGEYISWDYVVSLHRAQQKDVLHLGNKLKSKHVKWQNYKMKVSVAAQTFSHSVSAAITFLRKLKLKDFQNSKATSDFILLMNNRFDMLNSKSKFGKNSKRPISNENVFDIEASLNDSVQFLRSLKDTGGNPLVKGPRQTFITGFSISVLSIIAIRKNLLQRLNSPFEYILTYRFSQDTLECFFSKIRGRFGWNNNPTALQFKYAMRSLLLKNKIEAPNTANCCVMSNQHVVAFYIFP